MDSGLKATLGQGGANKGMAAGGIDPAGGGSIPDAPAEGSTGNPGTVFPWEGADATSLPGQVPPLKSL